MVYQIGIIGSSQEDSKGKEKATALGEEIARSESILMTGACRGFPYAAIKGAKKEGGKTVGISPAQSREEHLEKFQYPKEGHDAIIYTGFGYKGRNVILVRSCDAVIAGPGQTGTLNELTIAYGEGKVIGLLKGVSGASEEFEKVVERIGRPGRVIVADEDPKELVEKVLKELDRKIC